MRTFDSAAHLHDAYGTFLHREEVVNNLMLGILERNKDRLKTDQEIYWVVSHQDDALVLVMSGLHIILYANTTDEELYVMAVNALIKNNILFPGIIGPIGIADRFKAVYQRVSGKPLRIGMRQRIYQATTATYSKMDGVSLDLATEEDIPGLITWMGEFYEAAGEPVTPEKAEEKLTEKIKEQKLFLLRHQGQAVAMVAKERPFKDIITVSYVFTPKAFRCRGYATTSVGMLTETLLKTYKIITLYTDLANPVSNSIYQKIGYVPVIDSVVYLL